MVSYNNECQKLHTSTEQITAGIEKISDGQENKALSTRQAMEHPRKLCPPTPGWPLTTTARGCCTTTYMV